MKKIILSAVVSVLVWSPAFVPAAEVTVSGESPVKVEMRALNAAFLNLINSLTLNNPKAIEEPFHEVYKARANTEIALKNGEIKLPKNNDKMKQFVQMDEQFHKNTEMLIEAAKKGNMKKVQVLAHRLLNGCIECHKKFRGEEAPSTGRGLRRAMAVSKD